MEPWRAKLAEGDVDTAWDLFVGRYRPLLLATIRRLVEGEDVLDAFGYVCQSLSADRLARLRRFEARRGDGPARFSTWLVTVVHRLVIDWIRARDGRRRVRPPAGLSPAQLRIFELVFVEHRSHAEAFEIVSGDAGAPPSFTSFLRELAETYRAVERTRPRGAMHYFGAPLPLGAVEANGDSTTARDEAAEHLAAALDGLDAVERAAIQLFVVEELPAADVARIVGWPNAKAVYNRVYRALKRLRATLEADGIGREHL